MMNQIPKISEKHIRRSSGFTLIELMLVVGILALLVAIALPSYTQYVTRANRADAKDKLTEIMLEQERYNTRNYQYTLDLSRLGYPGTAAANAQTAGDPVVSDDGFYNISAAVCSEATISTCVNLTATPIAGGRQKDDGNLTLSSRGQKTGPWNR